MEEARLIIERLRTRITGILAERERIEENLCKLAEEKDNIAREKSELEQRIVLLERRIKVLELSSGVASLDGGAKTARDRVNRLLRDIDKCIALMNKQL